MRFMLRRYAAYSVYFRQTLSIKGAIPKLRGLKPFRHKTAPPQGVFRLRAAFFPPTV